MSDHGQSVQCCKLSLNICRQNSGLNKGQMGAIDMLTQEKVRHMKDMVAVVDFVLRELQCFETPYCNVNVVCKYHVNALKIH